MPNVVRGDRMSGLMVYLAGPGRHNEHEEPHLVAGDDALMVWYRDIELDRSSALAIARHLDRPRKVFGTEVMASIYERQQAGRNSEGQPVFKSVRTGSKAAHVWHCSLSLRADEGQLGDEKWGRIADDFVRAMGFDDNEGTKAACRWAAIRHGVSTDGNDHMHLAVNLVREDGTKASTHNDFFRAQQAARALEVVHGLERLESAVSAEAGATRGFTPGEQARAEKAAHRIARARVEQSQGIGAWDDLDADSRRARVAAEWRLNLPRAVLARTVRGCATAAIDEAEFVRRMRRAGLLVRPRFAEGTQDVITGYSVAHRPASKVERPVWYGGGRLGRDLTLTRLRGEWSDDPIKATEAAAEWNAAYRSRRVVAPGREVADSAPQMWEQYAADLRQLREQLTSVPLDDRDIWPRIARQTAGVLSAWSTRVEAAPGHLATAADALARSAQTYRRQVGAPHNLRDPFAGAALLVSAASRLGRGPVGQAAMLHELVVMCRAVAQAAEQAAQTRQAARLRLVAERNLDRVHARLVASEQQAATTSERTKGSRDGTVDLDSLDPDLRRMVERISAGQTHATDATRSPVPQPIEQPDQHVRPTAKEADRGVGRG